MSSIKAKSFLVLAATNSSLHHISINYLARTIRETVATAGTNPKLELSRLGKFLGRLLATMESVVFVADEKNLQSRVLLFDFAVISNKTDERVVGKNEKSQFLASLESRSNKTARRKATNQLCLDLSKPDKPKSIFLVVLTQQPRSLRSKRREI